MGKNAKKGKEKQQAMTSSTQQVKTTAVQRVLAEETIVEETEPSEAEDPLPIPASRSRSPVDAGESGWGRAGADQGWGSAAPDYDEPVPGGWGSPPAAESSSTPHLHDQQAPLSPPPPPRNDHPPPAPAMMRGPSVPHDQWAVPGQTAKVDTKQQLVVASQQAQSGTKRVSFQQPAHGGPEQGGWGTKTPRSAVHAQTSLPNTNPPSGRYMNSNAHDHHPPSQHQPPPPPPPPPHPSAKNPKTRPKSKQGYMAWAGGHDDRSSVASSLGWGGGKGHRGEKPPPPTGTPNWGIPGDPGVQRHHAMSAGALPPPGQAAWTLWVDEAVRLPGAPPPPKAPPPPPSHPGPPPGPPPPGPSRASMARDQNRQMLNSLLEHPAKTKNAANQFYASMDPRQQMEMAEQQRRMHEEQTRRYHAQGKSGKKHKKQRHEEWGWGHDQSGGEGGWGAAAGWGAESAAYANDNSWGDNAGWEGGQQQGGWGDDGRGAADQSWGAQDNSGWGQQDGGNGWGQQESGWGQQDNGWGQQDDSGWGQHGGGGWGQQGGGGWGAQDKRSSKHKGAQRQWVEEEETEDGWDSLSEESYGDPKRKNFHPRPHNTNSAHFTHSQAFQEYKPGGSGYSMTSRTLAHAYAGTPLPENPVFLPGPNPMTAYGDLRFIESKGQAIVPVQRAFFGRERKAINRIHWMFPPNKDERVASLLNWIEAMRYDLAMYGLHKFLQGRERGGLFVNADFTPSEDPAQPAFDWITFDELQRTQDKTLQESVAFYNPGVQTVLFVFLPSQSGNSLAIWRRKLPVPSNVRLAVGVELGLAMAGLRREKDYVVHVDEIPPKQPLTAKEAKKAQAAKVKLAKQDSRLVKKGTVVKKKGAAGVPPKPGTKKKKRKKWWNPFTWAR